MAIFNPKLLIELAIDASNYAIGVEVGQIGRDKKYQLISFFLKKFLEAELNYEIYNKELLAIVRAIEENRYYLEGVKHQIIVYSNYQNLIYFTITKDLSQRQARQYKVLLKYDFIIKY